MIRTPNFWWRERPTLVARLLQPLGALYGAVTARRMARPGLRLPVPVICVGNLTVGGAGKTPMALALARFACAAGHQAAFLSRGYGRKTRAQPDVIRVDPARHKAEDCGDEPLLLAACAPTYVAVDRRKAARAAIEDGATLLILDDGLQNPSIHKDLVIAVADGAVGFGNGLCFPAGPLRAPVERQWPRVGLLCLIGPGAAGQRVAAEAKTSSLSCLSARLEPDRATLDRLRGRRLLAFAGLGRPQKFFETLQRAGLDLVGQRSFPDHHAYSTADLEGLGRSATDAGAILITTAKDRVRLPTDFPAEVLPVELVFDDPDLIANALAALSLTARTEQ